MINKRTELDNLLNLLIGMTSEDGRIKCLISGYDVRITRINSNSLVVTSDFNSERINFELDNGIITKCYTG